MPAKSSKSDYLILASLLAISLVFLLVVFASGRGKEPAHELGFRTSYSTNREGTIACFVLFERLGLNMHRLQHPFNEDSLESVDVLFVLGPVLPVAVEEEAALRRWIRAGGVLVFEPGFLASLESIHGLPTEPRLPMPVPWDEQEQAAPLPNGPADEPHAAGADMSRWPLGRDVERLDLRTQSTLAVPEPDDGAEASRYKQLLTDGQGPRIVERRLALGRVIVLADSSFVANGRIGRADNALLAGNLVYYALSGARGDRVAFDEYHFGFGSRESGWGLLAHQLFQTGPGWAVLSLMAAGAMFVIYAGRRFGTRREPGRARRRTKLEYVHAVGAALRRGGAYRLTFHLIYHALRRDVTRLLGLPEGAGPPRLAAALARRSGRPADGYETILRACESAAAGARLSRRQARALLDRLAEIEREVFDED